MLAAIAKDVRLLGRDRGALLSLFVLPILFMLAFGAIFHRDDRGATRAIATWAAAGDPRADELVRALSVVPGFSASRHANADDVRRAVARGDVAAGLVIARDRAPIEIVLDLGAPPQVRAPLEYALRAVVQQTFARELVPIEVRSPPGVARPLSGITAFQVSVPGNAVLFGFFIAVTVAMAFAVERRNGTWRRLLAAPVSRRRALLATLVPYFVIGCCQLAFLFAVGVLAFGMQIAGSLLALVAVSTALVACAVSLGLLFAAIGGSERQLGGIGSVVLLVMGLFGGCMVPRLAMPPIMQTLGSCVPHAWALDGYYAILVREGTSLVDVAPAIGMLLVFAVAFAGAGAALFRFE
jgi:ABC-type multidrug transport system permease subunit